VQKDEEHLMEKQQAYSEGRIFITLTLFFPGLFSVLTPKLSRFQILYYFFFSFPSQFEQAPDIPPDTPQGSQGKYLLTSRVFITEAALAKRLTIH
jgi:hypothetical protein